MAGRGQVGSPTMNERFTGQQWDGETGYLYAGARYYNPVIGRWNATDPLGELYRDTSPYNYVLNRPTSLWDPTGLCPEDGSAGDAGDGDGYCLPNITVEAERESGSEDDSGLGWAYYGSVSASLAGTGAYLKEMQHVRPNQWYSQTNDRWYSMKYYGNNPASVAERASALKAGRVYKLVGRGAYGVSVVIAVTDAGLYYANGGTGYSKAAKAGLDVTMGGVALIGPVGFGVATVYFVVDTTVGWDTLLTPLPPELHYQAPIAVPMSTSVSLGLPRQ